MTLSILPVRTRRERRTFLTFPWTIYRGDPLWVPPLLNERRKEIDPRRGVFFKRGEAELYVAWRDGQPVGTICAAEDRAINAAAGRRECTFGFFECIDDEEVAHALFGQAAAWAKEHDLEVLFGPFNLDRENAYGVLIEGRDRPPVVFCGHTPPYYERLFESYGFRKARGDSIAFAFELTQDTPAVQRLERLAERVRRSGRFHIRPADLAHLDDEVDRVHHMLNVSLAHLDDAVDWERAEVAALVDPFVSLADPDLVLFVEAEGKTVGWFPGLADFNEALIHVNGLRYPWNYAQLWWHMRRQPACLAVKSVLVVPEYWDTGASLLLFDEMVRRARAKGFSWLDLSLTAEDNPRTPVLANRMGAKLYKRYRTYRKSAD